MKLDFYLRFHTHFGQSIGITGNINVLGNSDPAKAFPMQFFNEDFWRASVEIDPNEVDELTYRYVFTNENGEHKLDADCDKTIDLKKMDGDVILLDSWNDQSFYENAFFTAPFSEIFCKEAKKVKVRKHGSHTHQLRVKAPLIDPHDCVCLLGNVAEFGNWDQEKPLLLHKKGNWWTISLDLSIANFPISYKYGVYNLKKEAFVQFEMGGNRVLHNNGSTHKQTVVHDGFVRLPNTTWRGAGVAIPVFSLRSNNGFGIGEFTDIRLLVDWAAETGLKLIQILPINDTSATFTWKDSYPYAAISAFALHPIYVNLQKVAGKKNAPVLRPLLKKQKQLNQLGEIDYEQVIQFKMSVLKELFELDGLAFMDEKEFSDFFEDNKNWLVPYAAFCYLRDKYNTSDFSKWKTNSVYNEAEIQKLISPRNKSFKAIAFNYFVQYHLHLQLKDATQYAHKKGIAVKGDIPIGIYRYGCDAWTAPDLYNMNMQAGAPPDDFTIKGQNWGFPTYNWRKMAEDHYEWWKQRFHQMSNYFDSFRIDHILGFFRIWSVPIDAVEGILGRFIPAIPVHVNEFGEQGIWFDYDRYCKPYITDSVLTEIFGDLAEFVRTNYLLPEKNASGRYELRPELDSQRKVEVFINGQKELQDPEAIRQGLFDLITNVLLFEEAGSGRTRFHFRILIDHTSSFRDLDPGTRGKVYNLYINYFYRRQDEFWKQEALKKLPALKESTNMLICGEDLGMVPHTVPEVMQQLGILSLEIQRMPKNPLTEFFHPKDAPYLSVVTPSSHDMSTIRGWWEENREKTQRFFNNILGEQGEAPYFCEPWINRAILLQHLYSPAMWSIFQLQDILGASELLRRPDPREERINDPANANHYWNYRMHLSLEDLIREKEFNHEIQDYITNSGRS